MKLRILLIILIGLPVLFAVAVGLTSINHPIILKWVTGSAKHHGQPMPATVYTNGQVNENIKVYYTDQPKNYLLSIADYDSAGMIQFLNINLAERSIGRPAATSKNDFDIIGRHLFQSNTSLKFSPFQNNVKGNEFDPRLSFEDKQIKFSMPSNRLKFDSVRIILP